MKKIAIYIKFILVCVAATVIWSGSLFFSPLLADELGIESSGLIKGEFKATFPSASYQAQVNHPFKIKVNLNPFPAPAGMFYSILGEVLEKPKNARVKTIPGKQYLEMTADQPGLYRLHINVNILNKSSCGGIDIKEVATQDIMIQIED